MSITNPDSAAHMVLLNYVLLNIIWEHTGKKDNIAAKRRGTSWNGNHPEKWSIPISAIVWSTFSQSGIPP